MTATKLNNNYLVPSCNERRTVGATHGVARAGHGPAPTEDKDLCKLVPALIRRFPLIPIKDKKHLDEAISLMKELTTPSRLSSVTDDECNYLDVLIDLIAKYEKAHWKQLAKAMTP